MTKKNSFNFNRKWALVLILIADLLGWLSIILIISPSNKPITISGKQKIGLVIAILTGILLWVESCLTITPS